MSFRIEQYRIFNVVANSQSFSKAADELYMTQSAISQSIKQLEGAIDVILFQRTAKGVELTEAGELLYKYTSFLERGQVALSNIFIIFEIPILK